MIRDAIGDVRQGNDPIGVVREGNGTITFDSSRDAVAALS